jgi:hypothetical protein
MIKLPDGWRRVGTDLHCADGRILCSVDSPNRLTLKQQYGAPLMFGDGGPAYAKAAASGSSGRRPEGSGAPDPKAAAEARATAAALAQFRYENWWWFGG